MKTGIIWDLDGTLLDTLEDLKDATNYALTTHGFPPRTLAEIRRFVGNGAAKLIGKIVAERAQAAGIKTVVFDRGGYIYTGRVAELAAGAREGGLDF